MSTPKIFISYSHQDKKWKDHLVKHLQVLGLEGGLEVWDDRRLDIGDDWAEAIQKILSEANVALLLISADFLTSDFILNKEIPTLLKRREEEGIVVVPIIIKPCAWMSVNWLRQIQVFPKDGRPLSSGNEFEVEENLARITEEIANIFEIASSMKSRGISSTSILGEEREEKQKEVTFFISHCHDDGDFADLLKLEIEKKGYTAWTDLDRLSVGVDWRKEIDQAIKDSAALIVVMTPEARKSEYVTYEWAYAWGGGIKVIPIMLKPTQLHPRLETLQYLDFTNRRARPWSKLMETLREALNKK